MLGVHLLFSIRTKQPEAQIRFYYIEFAVVITLAELRQI